MDGDPQEAEEDERAIELSSLQAIFPEFVLEASDSFAASIALPVNPVEPLNVVFPPLSGGAFPVVPPTIPSHLNTNDEVADEALPLVVKSFSYLPPLHLKVKLPNGYPAQNPPVFKLSTQSSWLPQTTIEGLEGQGLRLWKEMGRDQVVYSYIDFLQEAANDAFGLAKAQGEAVQFPQDLETVLLDFDLKAKRGNFEQETFVCGICLEPKKGTICHRLRLCAHVFCVACLQDFYNSCITEGDVTQVKCLDPDCAKQLNHAAAARYSSQAQQKPRQKKHYTLDPSELLQIPLTEETVQRYVKLKRKKLLESNRSAVYCPRQWCQGPARTKALDPTILDLDSDPEVEESKALSKSQSFDPNASESTFPPPAERLAICTNCSICFTCNTHFCYLCSSWLSEDNPYAHFNTEGGECYMKLWELEEGDGEGARGVPVRAPPADHRRAAADVVVQLHRPQRAPVPVRAPSPPPAVRVNPRIRQGLARPRPVGGLPEQARGYPPMQGLQRFLQMVEDDNEEDWDSDELEEGVDVD